MHKPHKFMRAGEVALLLSCIAQGSDTWVFPPEVILAADAALTPRQMQVAKLYFLDKMKVTDIAEYLNVGRTTAGCTLTRAYSLLHQFLDLRRDCHIVEVN